MTVDDNFKKQALEDWLKSEMDKYVCFDLSQNSDNDTFEDLKAKGLAVAPLLTMLDPNGHDELNHSLGEENAFEDATDALLEIKKRHLEKSLKGLLRQQAVRKEKILRDALLTKAHGEGRLIEKTYKEGKLDEGSSKEALKDESSREERLPTEETAREKKVEISQAEIHNAPSETIDITNLNISPGKMAITSLSTFKKERKYNMLQELPVKNSQAKSQTVMAYQTSSRSNQLPDINDPNFYCCVCKKTFGGRYTYGFHLIQTHHIPDGIVFYKDVKSDHADLSKIRVILYCPICNVNFRSHEAYSCHLIMNHTSQSPLTGRTGKNPYVMPDINDQKFFCRTCQDHFGTKTTYQYHLICVHSMDYDSVFSNQKSLTSSADYTCSVCQNTFKCYEDYKDHQTQHVMGRPAVCEKDQMQLEKLKQAAARRREQSELKAAEKKRKQTAARRREQSELKAAEKKRKRELVPDCDDPNFYCKSCQYTLKTRSSYVLHLKRVHQIIQSTKVKIEKTSVVKMESLEYPPNYCEICDSKFASKYSYHHHQRQIHCI